MIKQEHGPRLATAILNRLSELGYELRDSDSYAKLEAEAQALREEVAALRARVVVVPERKISPNDENRYTDHDYDWHDGFNECLDELARLNGKTVSEADILAAVQRVEDLWGKGDSPHAGAMRHALCEVKQELSALLGEGKEHE